MKETYILKRAIIITIFIAATAALIFIGRRSPSNDISNLLAEVMEGSFKISVSATGELLAENSIELRGPMIPGAGSRRGRGRSIHAMSIKILDIVPEGIIVRKGDYVAQLDRTNYENSLKDELERLNKTKQVVLLGESNDKYIIVNDGLDPGTEIFVSPPENSWKFRLTGGNLISKTASDEEASHPDTI